MFSCQLWSLSILQERKTVKCRQPLKCASSWQTGVKIVHRTRWKRHAGSDVLWCVWLAAGDFLEGEFAADYWGRNIFITKKPIYTNRSRRCLSFEVSVLPASPLHHLWGSTITVTLEGIPQKTNQVHGSVISVKGIIFVTSALIIIGQIMLQQ